MSAKTIGVIADVATGNALISGGAGADPSYGKIGLTTHISGTLAVGNGGTGATTLTGYLVGNGTAAFSTTATIPTSDLSGTISLTTQISGTLGAGNGGTGISSYTVGDILYASGTTALSKLPDVATGNALLSGGVSNAPLWGKVGLVTHITGTLEVGNGGTGAVTLTTRGVLIGNGTNAVSATAAGTTGQVLVGNTGADPSWATLTGIGVTSFSAGTTGFTPATATTGAVTLAGTLNVANGGTSNTTLAANYLLKGNGVSPIATSVVYDDGTNVGIGTAAPGTRLDVVGPDNNGAQYRTSTRTIGIGSISGVNALYGGSGTELTFHIGSERMRINASGNLLVGTTTDFGGRLTLIPATTPTTFVGGNQLQIGEATNNTAYRLQVGYINHPVQGYVGSIQSYAGGVPSSLVLQGAGGNVGINTAAPGAKLETFNDIGGVNALRLNTNFAGGNYVDINPYISGVSNGGFSISLNGTIRQTIDTSGSITANVDFRAPIFYDSNNTAYYVDPNSTSRIVRLALDNGDNLSWGGVYGAGIPTIAGSTSNGLYFYPTGSTAGNTFTMFSSYAIATGSMRAPLFYDSDNTSYYLDPAGSSVLGIITAQSTNDAQLYLNGNGTSWAGIQWTDVSGSDNMWYNGSTSTFAIGGGGSVVANKKLHINGGTTIGSGLAASSSGVNGLLIEGALNAGNGNLTPAGTAFSNVITGRGTNRVVAFDGNGTVPSVWWTNGGTAIGAIDAISGGGLAHWANNGSSWQQQMAVNYGNVTINTDIRSPIYYDSNNTTYYVDPASGSNLVGQVQINGGTTMSGGWNRALYLASQFPVIVMNSGSVKYSAIGVDYTEAQSGMVFWVNGNSADITNGSATIALRINTGNFIVANDVRATIFYDSNNTAFFVDPNSTSVLNTIRASRVQFSNSNPAIVLDNTSYQILYDPTGNAALYLGGADPANYYDNSTHYFRTRGGSNMAVMNSNGIQAPIFYDLANTGYYGDFAGTSNLFNLTISGGGNKYLQIQSTDGGEAMVRYLGATGPSWYVGKRTTSQLVDTASFHFYSESAGATVGGIDVSGNMFASTSFRAPIFYDSNNTGYYVDPASGTVLGGTVSILGGRNITLSTSGGNVQIKGDAGGWSNGLLFYGSSNTFRGGFGALGSGDGLSYLWAGNDYNNAALYLYASNYAESPGSFRAPIFYDSNDTSYYVDPNSNSRLVNLGLGGVTPDVRLSVSGDAHISAYLYMGGTAGSVGSWSSRLLSSGGSTTLNTSIFEVNSN